MTRLDLFSWLLLHCGCRFGVRVMWGHYTCCFLSLVVRVWYLRILFVLSIPLNVELVLVIRKQIKRKGNVPRAQTTTVVVWAHFVCIRVSSLASHPYACHCVCGVRPVFSKVVVSVGARGFGGRWQFITGHAQ